MIKYVNSFCKDKGNICGLGHISGSDYEFYLDGEAPDIWVDVHKHWVAGNCEAWDEKKSKSFKTFDQCVKYINKLFNDDLLKYKPIGFKYSKQ